MKNNLIFIHGPSGAGKGELAKVLISNFPARNASSIADAGGELLNKSVFYGASGDFFRAAMANNPQLAAEMASGKYIDSLYPIKDEIQKLANAWRSNNNSVLILDGVVRRIAFDNVPHQIDQIAGILGISRADVMAATHIAINAHPDDQYAQLAARNVGRSDDHEAGIRKRMANWTDFARQAVLDLGYTLNDQGELSSTNPNLLTINNGKYYGIGLEEFRHKCKTLLPLN